MKISILLLILGIAGLVGGALLWTGVGEERVPVTQSFLDKVVTVSTGENYGHTYGSPLSLSPPENLLIRGTSSESANREFNLYVLTYSNYQLWKTHASYEAYFEGKNEDNYSFSFYIPRTNHFYDSLYFVVEGENRAVSLSAIADFGGRLPLETFMNKVLGGLLCVMGLVLIFITALVRRGETRPIERREEVPHAKPGAEIEIVPILKRSFKSLVEDPGFIGLYLIPYVVVLIAVVHVWLAFQTLDPTVVARTFINVWRDWIVWIVIYAVALLVLFISVQAAIILKAGARARGKVISVGEAFMRGIGYFPRLLVAGILAGLIVAGPMVLLVLAIFLMMPMGAAVVVVAVMGIMLWIIPMIYIAVRLALYAQACVLDDEGCVGCLKRSWGLTKGNFWLIFVMMFLFWIISVVIGLIPVVGSLVATLLVGPAAIIAYTFLYLGLKKQAKRSPAAA